MAQYYTDFSEYTSGALPTGWTSRWDTISGVSIEERAGATGGKVISAVHATGRMLLSWDAIDGDAGRATCEMVFRVRRVAGSYDSFQAACRASGNGSAETGMVGGYFAGVSQVGRRWVRYVSGTATVQGNNDQVLTTLDAWSWVRIRADGSTYSVKRWNDGDSEPGSWEFQVTDANISAAGWVGLMFFLNFTGTTEYDVFGVGTGGDSAPTSAPVLGFAADVSASATVTADLSAPSAPTELACAVSASGAVSANLVLAAVRRMRVPLFSGTTPVGTQTGVLMHWWDSATPVGAPVISVTDGVIDAGGAAELILEGDTSLAEGDFGYALITKIDGTDHRNSLVFAGRQTVQLL
jgi:hypothetical protein